MSLFLNFFSNEIAIQTSICLQSLASIQPRTGLSKFAKISQKMPEVREIKVRKNMGSDMGSAASAAMLTAWYAPLGVRTCALPGSRRAVANLTRLVLGCIEAKFCKKICVGKLSPISTQCTPFLQLGRSARCLWKM